MLTEKHLEEMNEERRLDALAHDRREKLAAFIDGLTLEQAREYEKQTDKLVWIECNLLDPADIPRAYAERVETALRLLLEAQKSATPPEAVARLAVTCADAYAKEAGLPTYTELVHALATLGREAATYLPNHRLLRPPLQDAARIAERLKAKGVI